MYLEYLATLCVVTYRAVTCRAVTYYSNPL